ncbi:MAG: SRPBCC domain-containing protein [Candidatus Limnocylindrales bacterium]
MTHEPPNPIDLTVETDAAPDRAWAALTDPRLVADWFTDASAVGRIGDAYRLDFGDGSVVEGVVMELEPGRRFSYTWMWADAEPHEETLVAWSVERRDGGGTSIRLVHDGWAEAGLDETIRDDHEGYWAGYLEDLVAVLAEAG